MGAKRGAKYWGVGVVRGDSKPPRFSGRETEKKKEGGERVGGETERVRERSYKSKL